MLDPDAVLPTWRPKTDESDGVLAFSTRRGGVSLPPFDSLNLGRSTADDPDAVQENRRRFLDVLGLEVRSVATAGQVHGDAISRVDAPGLHPHCDALLTRVPGIALAVTTADCMPLLMTTSGAIAAVHSGWRGTAAGAPAKALAALCAVAQTTPSRVTVHIGPSIRACCYRVGHDVARRFPAAALQPSAESWHLDLVVAARLQLTEAGVAAERIHDVPACTACDPITYFSHRRDGPRTGRHWGAAALRA